MHACSRCSWINPDCTLDGTAVQVKLTQRVTQVYILLLVSKCERWVGSEAPHSKQGTPPTQGLTWNSPYCKPDPFQANFTQRVSKLHMVVLVSKNERWGGGAPPHSKQGTPPPPPPGLTMYLYIYVSIYVYMYTVMGCLMLNQ